jgi:phytoene dehydrogenase-like protein
MRGALESLRAGLGLPAWPRPALPVFEPGRSTVIVTRLAGPLRALAEAARYKLEELSLEAVACDELGHGLHARIWRRPEAHHLLLLSAEGDEPSTWSAIRRWCAEAGVPTTESWLSSAPGPGVLPLQVMEHGLAIIEALCLSGRIDWRMSRIPASADWLRDVSTQRVGNSDDERAR